MLITARGEFITNRRAMAGRRKMRRWARRAKKQGICLHDYLFRQLLRGEPVKVFAKIDTRGWVMSQGSNG